MISACQTSECLESGKCVTIPNGQCRKEGDKTCKLFNGDKEARNQEGQCLDQCPDGKGYDSADKDTTRECKACTLSKISPNEQGQCAVCHNSECIKDGKCVPLPDGQCRKEEDGKCQAFSDVQQVRSKESGKEGQCLAKCPAGEGYDAVDKDTTRACKVCDKSQRQFGPDPNDGTCKVCEGTMVPNASGDMCDCPTDEAELTRGTCTVCGAGKIPSSNHSACEDCPTDKAEVTKGTCTTCPAGQIVDSADKTKCKACPANNAETTPGTCTACRNGVNSADKTKCITCRVDQAHMSGMSSQLNGSFVGVNYNLSM